MDWTSLESVAPLASALVSGIFTYFVTLSKNKKDLTMHDRTLLSQDEKEFRAELRAEIKAYKEEIKAYKEELKDLRDEISQLREINLQLEIENRELNSKVDILVTKLERRDDDDKVT